MGCNPAEAEQPGVKVTGAQQAEGRQLLLLGERGTVDEEGIFSCGAGQKLDPLTVSLAVVTLSPQSRDWRVPSNLGGFPLHGFLNSCVNFFWVAVSSFCCLHNG